MSEGAFSPWLLLAALAAWVGWALISETRHNHGLWVALMLPLLPLIVPVLWLVYGVVKYGSLLVFVLRGRRHEHADFMLAFRRRAGVFMLF